MDLSLCFQQASEVYDIPKKLMVVIAYVESGLNPKAYNRNKNGTYDIGIMQVNSSNIPLLMRKGIIGGEQDLWHPCKNIMAGGYILRECILKNGVSWKAVDCYNKGKNARETSKYVWKVYRTLEMVNLYASGRNSEVTGNEF
ncbi:MAG: lytic transglycosylase domain-containing protein [Aquificaceae bacterium]|jgi:soluble lytic murein transglycosylase-like protein|uniref:lytic transglycosylase domain-containing protein n=1 Tax=Hydrogenobacter sp. Uz 6-8 TaxID=3384828 RepID=UPI00309BE5C7